MFVHGNGKWHAIRDVKGVADAKFYYTYCGFSYSSFFDTFQDECVMKSADFCPRCFVEMLKEEDDDEHSELEKKSAERPRRRLPTRFLRRKCGACRRRSPSGTLLLKFSALLH